MPRAWRTVEEELVLGAKYRADYAKSLPTLDEKINALRTPARFKNQPTQSAEEIDECNDPYKYAKEYKTVKEIFLEKAEKKYQEQKKKGKKKKKVKRPVIRPEPHYEPTEYEKWQADPGLYRREQEKKKKLKEKKLAKEAKARQKLLNQNFLEAEEFNFLTAISVTLTAVYYHKRAKQCRKELRMSKKLQEMTRARGPDKPPTKRMKRYMRTLGVTMSFTRIKKKPKKPASNQKQQDIYAKVAAAGRPIPFEEILNVQEPKTPKKKRKSKKKPKRLCPETCMLPKKPKSCPKVDRSQSILKPSPIINGPRSILNPSPIVNGKKSTPKSCPITNGTKAKPKSCPITNGNKNKSKPKSSPKADGDKSKPNKKKSKKGTSKVSSNASSRDPEKPKKLKKKKKKVLRRTTNRDLMTQRQYDSFLARPRQLPQPPKEKPKPNPLFTMSSKRLEQLSKPNKRLVRENLKQYKDTLPPRSIEYLQNIIVEPPVEDQPDDIKTAQRKFRQFEKKQEKKEKAREWRMLKPYRKFMKDESALMADGIMMMLTRTSPKEFNSYRMSLCTKVFEVARREYNFPLKAPNRNTKNLRKKVLLNAGDVVAAWVDYTWKTADAMTPRPWYPQKTPGRGKRRVRMSPMFEVTGKDFVLF